MITVLKSKIHTARVTYTDLMCDGSITVDRDIMSAANIIPYEKVDVLNINNGARFSTYVIEGDSGVIGVNGAAARLVMVGDEVIILSYCQVPIHCSAYQVVGRKETIFPKIIKVDKENKIE